MEVHIDNHSDHHHSHYDGSNKMKLLGVIILNTVITVAEYIGGLLSGSLALLSDAGHNLSDVLSLMLGYAGEKASEKKSSEKYTFGFKRIEVLVALINALTLVLIGIYILYEAVMRFLNPVPIDITIMIPIAAIGLLGNVLSIIILSSKRKSNLNMKAAFLHLLYDAVSSVAVIIAGIVLYFTGFVWIDIIISLIIVVMIVWSSIAIIRESLRIFLQGTPAHINIDNLYQSLLSVEHIAGVHGLHVWSINSNEVFLSCHICVNRTDKTDTNKIIGKVNAMLEEEYSINHTTLQVENDMVCDLDSGICCR